MRRDGLSIIPRFPARGRPRESTIHTAPGAPSNQTSNPAEALDQGLPPNSGKPRARRLPACPAPWRQPTIHQSSVAPNWTCAPDSISRESANQPPNASRACYWLDPRREGGERKSPLRVAKAVFPHAPRNLPTTCAHDCAGSRFRTTHGRIDPSRRRHCGLSKPPPLFSAAPDLRQR